MMTQRRKTELFRSWFLNNFLLTIHSSLCTHLVLLEYRSVWCTLLGWVPDWVPAGWVPAWVEAEVEYQLHYVLLCFYWGTEVHGTLWWDKYWLEYWLGILEWIPAWVAAGMGTGWLGTNLRSKLSQQGYEWRCSFCLVLISSRAVA